MSEKICRTNWLIQRFFCLQIASSRSSLRVQCFRPYSALDFLELARLVLQKSALIMNEITALKIQTFGRGGDNLEEFN